MPPQQPHSGTLSWGWILAGIVGTAALLAATVQIVDPTLQRPRVLVLIAAATLMLGGVVMGRVSPGETIVEGGVAGAVVFTLAACYLSFVRGVDLPGISWMLGPVYAAMFATFAAWVGEMLQGTVKQAHNDKPLDWPWVFVCIVCGFLLEAYILVLGGTFLDLTATHLLVVLLFSVLATGWLVGFFSPGFTAVEPAIASVVLVFLSAGLADLCIDGPLSPGDVGIGLVGGLVFGLAGGWLGELTQSGRRATELRRLVRGV